MDTSSSMIGLIKIKEDADISKPLTFNVFDDGSDKQKKPFKHMNA